MIHFFCPRWGSDNLNWDAFCEKVRHAGYDGIEYGIPSETSNEELDLAWNAAEKNGLEIIAQHYDTCEPVHSKHFDLYNEWLQRIKVYPVIKINSQTGKDFFSFDENRSLIDAASDFTGATGIEVVHETHRNKFAFATHITKDYLDKIPSLKLTLDASHWVCVAESYLEDQQEAMTAAIERTEHIHARVGYPEGPQVPDPRIAQWQHALATHLKWWDRVVERKKGSNSALTITSEFGPFPYMVVVPETGLPVANQWEMNVFMMNLLKARYNK